MGLNVYVGSLTRYYSGDWETIIEQVGREQGFPVEVIRTDDYPPSLFGRVLARLGLRRAARRPPPERVREAVLAWRQAVRRELEGKLHSVLDWEEEGETPYFTDKPNWCGYAGLVLLAAHDEHPEFPRPTTTPDDWTDDPAWQASAPDNFGGSRYAQILAPEIWLPCHFDFHFQFLEIASGTEVAVGSSIALLRQLRELNERSFHGTPEDLARWGNEAPSSDAPFEPWAQFALALYTRLAEESVSHGLPMKLDY